MSGEYMKTEITRDELYRIFFKEGNKKWENVHMVLPEPIWEKIYEDGSLLYEGFTVDHKAFGAGKAFHKDGRLKAEGIFGLKGLLCGREYYLSGGIRFEGNFRMNQGYGPNYPDYGSWYDEDGELKYRGKFEIFRSSLGWPMVNKPEGFSLGKDLLVKGHTFTFDDARKSM